MNIANDDDAIDAIKAAQKMYRSARDKLVKATRMKHCATSERLHDRAYQLEDDADARISAVAEYLKQQTI